MTRKNSKKLRKFLTLFCCAALLVCMTIAGTLAYLTSSDSVENTFTVGDAVSIKLDEADVKTDGTYEYKEDGETLADRVQKNEYKLMPGHKYIKDPTVHVTGEDCYVFVTVANGISSIEAAGNTTIANQMAAKGWKKVTGVEGQDNLYVYTKGGDAPVAVSKNTDLIVFENFTVKTDADHTALEAVKAAKITINAYAVQKDGFESMTAAQIWTAAGFAAK